MKPIDYFKLQSKNLFKDFKTKKPHLGVDLYQYSPKFFDVDGIVSDFDIDEDNFTLMNAQHIIAQLSGFAKWTELLKASDTELKLAKLIFDNLHKISAEEWKDYLIAAASDNNAIFSTENKLEIFKDIFVDVEGHVSIFHDYRLNSNR